MTGRSKSFPHFLKSFKKLVFLQPWHLTSKYKQKERSKRKSSANCRIVNSFHFVSISLKNYWRFEGPLQYFQGYQSNYRLQFHSLNRNLAQQDMAWSQFAFESMGFYYQLFYNHLKPPEHLLFRKFLRSSSWISWLKHSYKRWQPQF